MENVAEIRKKSGFSQRRLAEISGVPFRTVQLVEGGGHDPQMSTLAKVAGGLGFPPKAFERWVASFFRQPPDSVVMMSERLIEEGEESWKSWLFDFVDSFRSDPRKERIDLPPVPETSFRMRALLASTVEALCNETGLAPPEWCAGVPPLPDPWFVAGMESLKATALAESPVHFRKRNIFVLENFLSRA